MKIKNRKYGVHIYILLLYCCILYMRQPLAAQEQFVLSSKQPVVVWQDTTVIIDYISYGQQLLDNNQTDYAELILYSTLQSSLRIAFFSGIRNSIVQLTNSYRMQKKYDEIIALYLHTLNQSQQYPALVPILSGLHNNIAIAYNEKGNFSAALHHYQQAIQLYDSLRSYKYNIGSTYNNLSMLFIQFKKHDQARYYLQKAENTALNNNDWTLLSSVYGNMGNYYFEAGHLDSSLLFSKKALIIAQQNNLKERQFHVLINLGETYRQAKQPENAIPYLKKAITIDPKTQPVNTIQALSILGGCYIESGNYQLGKKYLEEALKEAKAIGLNKRLLVIYAWLSAANQALGQYEEALEYYKLSKAMEDSIAQEGMKKNLLEWDVKYRTSEKDKSIAQKQLEINQQKNAIKNRNVWIAAISSGLILLTALLLTLYRASRLKTQRQEERLQLLEKQQEVDQLKAIMEGEEKERKRMSQELHDGIGGMLASVHMNLSTIEEKMKDKEEKEQVGKVLHMLQETSNEVRKSAHNLLPDVLSRHNLEEALLIYCEQINISNRLNVQFQYHVHTHTLEKSAELLLYRISQELLQNILKHAQATIAWLLIKELNNKLSIIVEDNGTGFDYTNTSGGYGLLNLQYRVKALQGSLDIQSVANRGTTIHIEFDINKLTAKSA